MKYLCKISDKNLQDRALKHMFYELFSDLLSVGIVQTFTGIWIWERLVLSEHVGFAFCMHVAVKKCVCVIVGKNVQIVCCGAGAGVWDNLWPRVSCVGCSEEAYKLKIELLETGGIHYLTTKPHLQCV